MVIEFCCKEFEDAFLCDDSYEIDSDGNICLSYGDNKWLIFDHGPCWWSVVGGWGCGVCRVVGWVFRCR